MKRFATLTPEQIEDLPEGLFPGHDPHFTEAGTLVRNLPRRVRQSLLKRLGAYSSELVRPCFDTKSAESGKPVSPTYCVTILTEDGCEVLNRVDKGIRTADNMSDGCTCVGCSGMGDAILAEI